MQKLKTHGVAIDVGKTSEYYAKIKELKNTGGAILTVNPLMLDLARRDRTLPSLFSKFDLIIPDGRGLSPLIKNAGLSGDILPGIDLSETLLSWGGSVAFIGGKPGVAERAFSRMKSKYEKIEKAFIVDGFSYTELSVGKSLEKTKPTYCFVCLGFPKQEFFIERVRRYSPKTVYLGLGGTFDVWSGEIPRAPKIFRLLGIEWFYRMLREPKRMKNLPSLIRFRLSCQ